VEEKREWITRHEVDLSKVAIITERNMLGFEMAMVNHGPSETQQEKVESSGIFHRILPSAVGLFFLSPPRGDWI